MWMSIVVNYYVPFKLFLRKKNMYRFGMKHISKICFTLVRYFLCADELQITTVPSKIWIQKSWIYMSAALCRYCMLAKIWCVYRPSDNLHSISYYRSSFLFKVSQSCLDSMLMKAIFPIYRCCHAVLLTHFWLQCSLPAYLDIFILSFLLSAWILIQEIIKVRIVQFY